MNVNKHAMIMLTVMLSSMKFLLTNVHTMWEKQEVMALDLQMTAMSKMNMIVIPSFSLDGTRGTEMTMSATKISAYTLL